MGRFHRHDDGTEHDHDHDDADDGHAHAHDAGRDVGDMTGYETGTERVQVLEAIFDENDRVAAANRADFAEHGVRVVNLMSSPGAGKTTLLRETLVRLQGKSRVGIIEGDIETSIDADRLEGLGASVALVNTGNGFGGECHLDAPMVRSALGRVPLAEIDVLFIENVGNLVCPAEFRVGEDVRAMVCSVTEGEDKPMKYPLMFRACELVVINKIDLLDHLEFDLDKFLCFLDQVHPGVERMLVSARTGEGIEGWRDWLLGITRRERALA